MLLKLFEAVEALLEEEEKEAKRIAEEEDEKMVKDLAEKEEERIADQENVEEIAWEEEEGEHNVALPGAVEAPIPQGHAPALSLSLFLSLSVSLSRGGEGHRCAGPERSQASLLLPSHRTLGLYLCRHTVTCHHNHPHRGCRGTQS